MEQDRSLRGSLVDFGLLISHADESKQQLGPGITPVSSYITIQGVGSLREGQFLISACVGWRCIPLYQMSSTGDSCWFDRTMSPRLVIRPSSVALRTITLFRRVRSNTRRLSRASFTFRSGFRLRRSCSSSRAVGDNNGVDEPDKTSLRPITPLCGVLFGAGKPFRKCSSSASVPLSLAGDDSL